MTTARKKTTLYLDPELLLAVKDIATSSERHYCEVIEEALDQYVEAALQQARSALLELLDNLDDAADLDDNGALNLAYAELHAMRRERRTG